MADSTRRAVRLWTAMLAVVLIGLAVAIGVQAKVLADQRRKIHALEAMTQTLQKQNMHLAKVVTQVSSGQARELHDLSLEVAALKRGRAKEEQAKASDQPHAQ